MPKTGWQDPGSSEVRSTHISGLQEAIGKIEDILDVQLQAETGIELSEVYIFEGDRYRIYQAPEGKRNWATSPAPVIKKNSVPISTGFTIDYGGGAVIFSTPLSGTDTVTADFSRTKTDGNKLAMLDAADVPYDNTESELTATDTQAAIDETVDMVKTHKAEDASTTKKGHVQLSSAVDSISESLAATSKAVKTAYDKANEKPFVVGTYTGDDTASQTIVLGFRPSAVFLENKSGVHDMGRYGGFALDGYPTFKWNTSYEYLTIVSNGFTVYFDSNNQIATNDDNPYLNPYRYIAYK